MKKIILSLLASGIVANGSITVSSAAVTNLADENGVELSPIETRTFAVLVELNGNASDTFDGLVMSDTISIGQTVGEGKYFVLNTGMTVEFEGVQSAQANVSDFDLTGTPLDSDAAAGNNVALIWFPDINTSDPILSAGDVYGVARDTNWVLPSDGAAETFDNIIGVTQQANFIVQAVVPEPSSIALLGLGAFGLITRRRRA